MVEASVGWVPWVPLKRCPDAPSSRGQVYVEMQDVNCWRSRLGALSSRNPGVQVMDGQLGTKHFHPFFTCFI